MRACHSSAAAGFVLRQAVASPSTARGEKAGLFRWPSSHCTARWGSDSAKLAPTAARTFCRQPSAGLLTGALGRGALRDVVFIPLDRSVGPGAVGPEPHHVDDPLALDVDRQRGEKARNFRRILLRQAIHHPEGDVIAKRSIRERIEPLHRFRRLRGRPGRHRTRQAFGYRGVRVGGFQEARIGKCGYGRRRDELADAWAVLGR